MISGFDPAYKTGISILNVVVAVMFSYTPCTLVVAVAVVIAVEWLVAKGFLIRLGLECLGDSLAFFIACSGGLRFCFLALEVPKVSLD